MSVVVSCPQCQAKDVRRHCDRSKQCDWILCRVCGGYGWPNGRRWVRGDKRESKK